VNAIALPLGASDVIDLFGGQADLDARLIRAVTERSFRDDPARTMRAVRLASELGFQIEPQTAIWIRRDACLLANVSAERVRDELARLLARPDAFAGIRQMDELELLAQVLPEVAALRGVEQTARIIGRCWTTRCLPWVFWNGLFDAGQAATPSAPYLNAPEFVWDDLAADAGRLSHTACGPSEPGLWVMIGPRLVALKLCHAAA